MPTNNETINRRIAEFMGLCWHESESAPSRWGWDLVARCSKCGGNPLWNSRTKTPDNPDYCSSSSPRRLLDEVVEKLIVDVKQSDRLMDELMTFAEGKYDGHQVALPASVIATAIYNVLTNGEEGKGKDEREAAIDSIARQVDEKALNLADPIRYATGLGYDAGLAARPEPPEPDGDLVAAARNSAIQQAFNAVRITFPDANWRDAPEADDVYVGKLIFASGMRFAQQHAVRADAPADVCEWKAIKSETDLPAIGECVIWHDAYTGNRLHGFLTQQSVVKIFSDPKPLYFEPAMFNAWCPVPQFTPAPTSPERRSEVSGTRMWMPTEVAAERTRIAAELRAVYGTHDLDAYARLWHIEQYIDKLEGKQHPKQEEQDGE